MTYTAYYTFTTRQGREVSRTRCIRADSAEQALEACKAAMTPYVRVNYANLFVRARVATDIHQP
jgi:hypothetical protein